MPSLSARELRAHYNRGTRMPKSQPPDHMNPIMPERDWTCDATGRANSSAVFLALVDEVADMLRNCRLGDNPSDHARLIVAQLAHVHGLAPKNR